jgi:PAS domain S-box-containing protein
MPTSVPLHLIPPHEAERLEELAAYQILYTQAEEAFDNLTRIMAQVFETPMVFMSLVDSHTVFYKSQVGPFGRSQVSRDQSLCSLSILKTEPTVFEDTWQESTLTTNPLIRGEAGIRFYAGAPLITAHGHSIGSICVVDTSPRVFPQARRELLQQFARVFIHEMDQRLTSLNLARAQAATAASEARLSTVIAHVPASMVVYRGREHIVEMPNQNFITLIDRGPDVSGKPLGELMPELRGQAYLGILDEVYTTGQPYRSFGAPVAIRQRDGAMQHRFMDVNYAPLFDSAGQVEAILSVATDVTDVVVARRERDESQRQLLALFEQSPVALATYSADDAFVIQWANPFFGELVARPPQALVGKPLLEALPELNGQGFEELLKTVITSNTPFIAPEVAVNILRDGQLTTIYVDLTYQPQRGALENVEAILVVVVDVTQQVLARQKIEEAEGRLRAIIRHLPSATVVFRGRELIVETPSQNFIDILDRGPDVTGKPLSALMPELENQSGEI